MLSSFCLVSALYSLTSGEKLWWSMLSRSAIVSSVFLICMSMERWRHAVEVHTWMSGGLLGVEAGGWRGNDASQAIITATFLLVSQIISLSFFPRVKVSHTSKRFYGQIYIPLANWLLMLGSVAVTAIYNDVSLTVTALKTSPANLVCINRPQGWVEHTAFALR